MVYHATNARMLTKISKTLYIAVALFVICYCEICFNTMSRPFKPSDFQKVTLQAAMLEYKNICIIILLNFIELIFEFGDLRFARSFQMFVAGKLHLITSSVLFFIRYRSR